jgi:hypothetical protein
MHKPSLVDRSPPKETERFRVRGAGLVPGRRALQRIDAVRPTESPSRLRRRLGSESDAAVSAEAISCAMETALRTRGFAPDIDLVIAHEREPAPATQTRSRRSGGYSRLAVSALRFSLRKALWDIYCRAPAVDAIFAESILREQVFLRPSGRSPPIRVSALFVEPGASCGEKFPELPESRRALRLHRL